MAPSLRRWASVAVPTTAHSRTVDYVVIYVWEPDSNAGTYRELFGTDVIEPHVAYWLSLETAPVEPVVLHGTSVEADVWSADLSAGWNIIGTPYSDGTLMLESLKDGGSSQLRDHAIYWWDTENKCYGIYESDDAFVLGTGYWMAATGSCTLTFVELESCYRADS